MLLPTILVKRLEPIEVIENFVLEVVNKYLSHNVPVEVHYLENLEKPFSLVAGITYTGTGELVVREVSYLSDTNGSEESQLTIQYEGQGFKILAPIFLVITFYGVLITKELSIKIINKEVKAHLERVVIYIIGKRFEKVKNKLQTLKDVKIIC
ncbi:MAG: hypothetical protein B6V02_02265 [Thermoprotei archaeon ex4572_64]|nr:MAG: hypothetical protein B6V02_02265 [Thermoprotei archaeon ex4572_64]